jgi:hypothetical protein
MRYSPSVYIDSHAKYIGSESAKWLGRVRSQYPKWTEDAKTALAMLAIDLENVSGRSIALPSDAATVCDVLEDRSTVGSMNRRSNFSVLADQKKGHRLTNALTIFKREFAIPADQLRCLS